MERFLKGIWTVALSLVLILSVTLCDVLAEEPTPAPEIEAIVENAASATDSMNLVYQSKVADFGWLDTVTNGQESGAPNQDLPINAFAISIPSQVGHISQRVSVQNESWYDWTSEANYMSGTVEGGNAIEAVQLKLTGGAEEKYDLYYSVKVKDFGWLDYAKNGEEAGSTGLNKPILAIKVTYTQKGAPAPGETECAHLDKDILTNLGHVEYSAHVAGDGWQAPVSDGQTAGTTGQGKAVEALTINMPNVSQLSPDSGISYKAEVQTKGWLSEAANAQMAGTTGESLHAEALTVTLTGSASTIYDVYYRVHSASYGWLDWAKNGEVAGTTGIDTEAQAFEVKVVLKGEAAPGATNRPSVTQEYLQSRANIVYNTSILNNGWQSGYSNGADAGTIGESKSIEAFTLDFPNRTPDSSVNYQANLIGLGWMDPVSNGNVMGLGGNTVEAVTASLSGEDGYSYDLYYQVYVQDYGWLGWAKNGQQAGTTGQNLRVEAMRFLLQPRNMPTPEPKPGSNESAFLDVTKVQENWIWPLDGYSNLSSEFGPRWGSNHDGIDIPAAEGTPIKAARSGTVRVANWYFGYGQCVIIINDDTGEECYYAHMSVIAPISQIGAHVNQGEVIGYVGNTGNSYGNHLHFGVDDHGAFVNPLNFYN